MSIHSYVRLAALMAGLTAPPVHATDFTTRCKVALTTVQSKGWRMALRSWPHLAEGPSLSLEANAHLEARSPIDELAERVARYRGRSLAPSDYEDAALEIAMDPASPPAALDDALQFASLIPLTRPAEMIGAFRKHPALPEPSAVLTISLNQSVSGNMGSVLIMQTIHDEKRYDDSLKSWEIPYSSRPAPRLIRLNRAGRINDGTLLIAFSMLFESGRADLNGLLANLEILASWIHDLYVAGKPLPAKSLTQPMAQTLRRRLARIDGDPETRNKAFRTLTRIEILFGI